MSIQRNVVAAYFHARMAYDPRFGYTQGAGRWGGSEWEIWECNGVEGFFNIGDRDCSSSVIDCWQEALRGSSYEGALAGATYTGNMRQVFVDSGLFVWHPMGEGYIAQKGDIYLNEINHTAMCQSSNPDILTEAVGNEWGGIVGGEVGDQTGGEFIERRYYDFPWDGILAYNHKADDNPKPKQEAGEPVNNAGMWYRMHVQDLGWLDPVHDGQTAGTTGYGLRGEALKITPPKGMTLDVKAHIQDKGWKIYKRVGNGYDPVIGTVGEALRLEGLEISVVDNPENLKVSYRCHIANYGWTGWVKEGFACGTVGCSLAIEAIEIKAE